MAHKVALLAAGAAVLDVIGRYLISLGGGTPADFGWFGYAPLTQSNPLSGSGLSPWLQLLIWLGLIAAWVALALFVLRRPKADT
jgi:heme/copper-type cytochrome/quinol oxidase subunit 1